MKTQEEINKINMKTLEEIGELAKENDRRGYERNCFIDGYTQCQQDMADKLKFINETLVKIRDCNDYGNNSSTLARELIETLNK